MSEKYTILGALWFTNHTLSTAITMMGSSIQPCIGIVAVETFPGVQTTDGGEWKAYIGLGLGYNLEDDLQRIASHGSGMSAEQGAPLFPYLSREKYKNE